MKLELDNAAVWKREHEREETPGWIAKSAPWPIRGAYLAICVVMDLIYDRRPIQRFWFLEVVARMPYFAYISMLHLYESLGWWRAGAELRKVGLLPCPCLSSRGCHRLCNTHSTMFETLVWLLGSWDGAVQPADVSRFPRLMAWTLLSTRHRLEALVPYINACATCSQ